MVNILKKLQEANISIGTELYSLTHGKVTYNGTKREYSNEGMNIVCKTKYGNEIYYDWFGKIINTKTYTVPLNAVCDLYPHEIGPKENYLYNEDMWNDFPSFNTKQEKLEETIPQLQSGFEEENKYWLMFSRFLALYLFINKGGTCGIHQYIKDKLGYDDDEKVIKICRGDYDFKLSEMLKLITPEEFGNTMLKADEYFKLKENGTL